MQCMDSFTHNPRGEVVLANCQKEAGFVRDTRDRLKANRSLPLDGVKNFFPGQYYDPSVTRREYQRKARDESSTHVGRQLWFMSSFICGNRAWLWNRRRRRVLFYKRHLERKKVEWESAGVSAIKITPTPSVHAERHWKLLLLLASNGNRSDEEDTQARPSQSAWRPTTGWQQHQHCLAILRARNAGLAQSGWRTCRILQI